MVVLAGPATVEARGIFSDPLVLGKDGISVLPLDLLGEGFGVWFLPTNTLDSRLLAVEALVKKF